MSGTPRRIPGTRTKARGRTIEEDEDWGVEELVGGDVIASTKTAVVLRPSLLYWLLSALSSDVAFAMMPVTRVVATTSVAACDGTAISTLTITEPAVSVS